MPKATSKQKVLSKQRAGRRKVVFTFESAGAKEIVLVGDFNNWNPKKHPMDNSGGSFWRKVLMLYPGRYEYKFYVDGEWKQDPRNTQTCRNCFGTLNSILEVSER